MGHVQNSVYPSFSKDILDTHFPAPTKTVTKIKKINVKDKYFVIGADEVYKEKVLKEEEKKQKTLMKEIRKQERERK